jgi:uncharacterized repeat protein (TIGR03806 family)
VGEVGSLGEEEINIATRGSNHQWSYREGDETFIYSGFAGEPPTELLGIETPPLHVYPQQPGTHCTQEGYCIIGGTVYRRSRYPQLYGQYLYGDFGTGRIWAMPAEGDQKGAPTQLLQLPSSGEQRLASLAVGRSGEVLLVIGPNAGDASTVLRLIPHEDKEPLPAHLSETGLFTSLNPLVPNPGLIPYDVSSPLWSSGTAKRRWIGLPPSEQIGVGENGSWSFPAGTVFVKHFDAPTSQPDDTASPLETRVLVRDIRGGVYGATYRWRDDRSDAVLVDCGGEELELPLGSPAGTLEPRSYRFPGRSECLDCHSQHAGFILGVNPRQLNRNIADEQHNQLAVWNRRGLFFPRLSTSEMSRGKVLVGISDPIAPLDKRVRSYLDANCSHCHRPGANIRAWFDLREQTPLSETGLIDGNVADSLEIPDARVVVPGHPDRSILYQRMAHPDTHFRMPPLAISVVDGVALREIHAWIEQLPRPESPER